MKENDKYIKDSHMNTVTEKMFVEDFYENAVAGIDFCAYEATIKYYINPELLKLGIEKKIKIENETKVIGEERINLGIPEPCSLEHKG